ncbi:cob(I)yrinic acid a,c-diamide adenosyltransferase [Marinilabilia rubra]|uniref:corrinoid adenosyltransferase n=1 Tax=Marinilabilia rubra TaxID=2162893 RepID=A0A2U2BCL6_9BACT|nr:cob(I)yrinic acid a,c-diamide adenosyltransferase [Marinilabilia rubra]PWE00809.1 cob(I)yrinic acid a,c-diamide adenosyltransferase [Marinilabilia rubra]
MIHIYTGNGKGKTTAAIGLAVRAAGSGMNVFFGQFVKGMAYNEVSVFTEQMPLIDHELFGRKCFINRDPEHEDYEAAKAGLKKANNIIHSGKYSLIVLDELNIALYYKLIALQDVLKLIDELPGHIELVITGRYAPQELIDKADLVTEMKEVKHYYKQDIKARKGIEF